MLCRNKRYRSQIISSIGEVTLTSTESYKILNIVDRSDGH